MSKYAKQLRRLKINHGFKIKVGNYESLTINLRVLSSADLNNKYLIKKLSEWRHRESHWFASQFSVTFSRTKNWLRESVINNPDRILFTIEDNKGKFYGHLGYYRYRSSDNSCELDNVVRGLNEIPGLMTDSVNALISWGFKNLGVDLMYLTTFSDNERAINLYRRNGFRITRKIPLKKIQKNNEIQWVKIPINEKTGAQRYYTRMVIDREQSIV
ncbi:MAG: hypothetical protein UU34_C0001G0159 [Candidatus Curtissbacteria bacterium GW2011_GWA1_41_11]|uniref:N-acetyltransferase domain-containing protein n=1 Tax=Candidatus Curtissbacteria bacterium GW2011_GWA1_41_11 TaxID=1618409 RepID=A0A0G0XKI0_9BACT|nr:MAG: hypothetical protein UU34_C0001G0159 [Candidatus Curtissbacteria bacterium GW2011_GWA1_41_11]